MSDLGLVPVEQPRELMVRGQGVASACREIVMRCSVHFAGRRYIQAEGWQALASLSGLTPRIETVEELETGDVRALCSLVRIADGEVMARAEGFVGTDEPVWFGGTVTDKWGKTKTLPKRSKFAIRAMAQTRATSRACRTALAWLVPLVDSSLATTPAEEMPWEQEQSSGSNPEVSGPYSGHNGAMSGPNSGHNAIPSEYSEDFPPVRHPMDRKPSDFNLVTPKQRGMLAALTRDLNEGQLAELVKRFGPSEKLDKKSASAVIEFLKGGGLEVSQPTTQPDDNYDPFAPDAEPV